ncbi:MAG: acyl-CoA/acyl-ACP dehydrogenase [Deltaproteobacteria bacterium]|nr:acyl-CoA/acyl-ACP dehydrogenase [Deltaproteobacteria bacterium]
MLTIGDKEKKLLADAAMDFATKALLPDREEHDHFPFGPFWEKALEQALDLGFFHVALPESMEGMGEGVSNLCVLCDRIAQVDASMAAVLFTNAFAQRLLAAAGEGKVLAELSSQTEAKKVLAAFPVFNNPGEIKHVAEAKKEKGKWRLSGRVPYVVLGGVASRAVVPAEEKGGDGYGFYLVSTGSPHITVSEPVFSLGLHACPAVDMEFDNAPATPVGGPDQGASLFRQVADSLQLAAGAMASGIMKGSFKEALDYSKKRRQGGRRIVEWSELARILADMSIQAKVADMSLARACQAADNGEPAWEQAAAAAAINAVYAACRVTTDGIQVLGGVGYMKDHGQEKRFRDAKQVQALLGLSPLRKIKYLRRMVR